MNLSTAYPSEVEPPEPPVLTRNISKDGGFDIGQVRSPRTIEIFEGNITALLFRVVDFDNPADVSYHLPHAVSSTTYTVTSLICSLM